MNKFFKYISESIAAFFATIGGALVDIDPAIVLGIIATLAFFYVIYVIFSDKEDKSGKIFEAIVFLGGSVFAAIAI